MSERPRLLVLGAGRHQLELIRRAEARGIAVVVSDYLADSPGKAVASFVADDGDAIDIERNIAIATEYGVDGVVTVGTDQAVPAVAAVADRLGLPCHVDPAGARRATDKAAMKDAFAEFDIPTAHAWILGDSSMIDDEIRDGLPVVVKPTDSQGQRATVVVRDPAQLAAAVDDAVAHSRAGTAAVEVFLEGPEVTATAWVIDGTAHLVAVTDRITFNDPPALGVCLEHVFPSRAARAADATAELFAICQRVADAYGMTSGPLYVQTILTPTGPAVVEAAARVGGGHEMTLFPAVAGFDLIDRSIDLAMGLPIDRPAAPFTGTSERHGLILFVVAAPGTVSRLSDMAELIGAEGVIDGSWYVDAGYRQDPIVNSLGRVGFLAITADSFDELSARTRAAHDRLVVADESGRNLLFWPSDDVMLGPRIG